MVTVRITDLSRGGAGVGRDDTGRVLFVPCTAPGDLAEVEVVEARKNYAQARLVALIEASPLRVAPRCPAFTRCGGCQWQHLPYELQWQTKLAGVRQALARAGVALPAQAIEEYPAVQAWAYRNRVQARGFRDELGFLAAGSDRRVPVDACAIARPEINERWAAVRAEGAGRPRPYKVEIEVLGDGTVRASWDAPHAALGFRQVHDGQNEVLRGWVAGQFTVDGAGQRTLYDLFGGSGNLSLGLAGRMGPIHCVDAGAPRGGATQPVPAGPYTFHRDDVASWIARQPRVAGAAPASAILDPPREGLGGNFTAIAEGLERLRVDELALIGCDADSWARDFGRFQQRGWRLEQLAAFDLFPQTPHVECGARLRR